MTASDEGRLDELVTEAIEHLLDEGDFDLEAFLREHSEHEAGLRRVLGRLRAAGLLPPGTAERMAREDADRLEPLTELLAALRRKPAMRERYDVLGEIGRGGMGCVLAVFDRELRRTLAMKILRTPSSDAVRGEMAARFLEEARITSQLTHQGIVPIHDLGLTEDGSLYYTMRLIEGRQTLSKVFELARAGREGWTQMRALDAILRACEAVAYAHQRGVIHRDLKPSNIMVGPLGEVFVVDWGLSRVLEAPSRERSTDVGRLTALESERGADSPYVTAQGRTLGTPHYMSPEQARGERDAVDARSDVYAMGAELYEFLTGRPPYAAESGTASSRELVDRIMAGPPRSIADAAPNEPSELVAICDKALQRQPEDRYPSITELAEDLRAFTEGRVVAAYETGTWAEARKWVRRNKPLAASLGAAFLLLVVGFVSSLVLKAQADERAKEVLRLAGLQDLQALIDATDDLWPAHPERMEQMRSWITRAERLLTGLPAHRAMLAQLQSQVPPQGSDEDGQVRWWMTQLTELIERLESLQDRETGLLSPEGISPEHGWSVPKRLVFAQELEVGFDEGGEHAQAWAEALPAIRDAYAGLDLTPQMGLLPIGPDPESGLWEFAHLMTGVPADRDSGGKLVLTEETGAVLVLVPGGSFWMGAQSGDPDGRNYDSQAQRVEGPVHEVELSAFFLSKYELTQGQWLRLTGRNPSYHQPPSSFAPTLLHPVEQVSWLECMEWLPRAGMKLPSEAQWEYGARANTDTAWWTGADRESLWDRHAANLADQAAARAGVPWPEIEDWPELDDGYPMHAPVGTYSANTFGLHEVAGNLWEWCLDGYDADFYGLSAGRDPICPWEGAAARVNRGGCFFNAAIYARSAFRLNDTVSGTGSSHGVRPARAIDP